MHSTFKMMGDLTRFGAIMLVLTLGFALGFYAMFGSTSAALPGGSNIPEFDTYYSSLLTLFASMLGNFDFEVGERVGVCAAGGGVNHSHMLLVIGPLVALQVRDLFRSMGFCSVVVRFRRHVRLICSEYPWTCDGLSLSQQRFLVLSSVVVVVVAHSHINSPKASRWPQTRHNEVTAGKLKNHNEKQGSAQRG